jgi:hypothetical protein
MGSCKTIAVALVALAFFCASSIAAAQGEEPPPETPPADEQPDPPAEPAPEPEPEPEKKPAPPAEQPKEDEDENEEEEEDEYHQGFFFRFALGLGWSWLNGDGTMHPAKGLRAIEDAEHNSPAFNLALSLGGGFLDLALHLGLLYERMILRADDPTEIGVTLFGLGGGATYYFTDNDFFVTAQVRLIGMLMFLPRVSCDTTSYYADKYEWYKGPGFSVTLGKEWYGDEGDEGGIGLGLQGNYARLSKDGGAVYHYGSLLLVLTLTHF